MMTRFLLFHQTQDTTHEAILGIVRPKMVLVYGNSAASAYSYLREKAGHPREHTKGAGHGNWKCRTFAAPAYTVVGVPHLSRYDITRHENIVTWIGNLLRRA
jgi:hypothetical protein